MLLHSSRLLLDLAAPRAESSSRFRPEAVASLCRPAERLDGAPAEETPEDCGVLCSLRSPDGLAGTLGAWPWLLVGLWRAEAGGACLGTPLAALPAAARAAAATAAKAYWRCCRCCCCGVRRSASEELLEGAPTRPRKAAVRTSSVAGISKTASGSSCMRYRTAAAAGEDRCCAAVSRLEGGIVSGGSATAERS